VKITQAQREAKATFWTRCRNNPLLTPDRISDADIRRLSPGGPTLPLGSKEFREWYLDKDAFEILLEVGKELAIKKLLDIVAIPDEQVGGRGEVTHAAQINAAKVLLDKSGVGQEKIVVSDSEIASMTEEELTKFINTKQQQPVLKAVDGEKD
jgi:hypothetical protein